MEQILTGNKGTTMNREKEMKRAGGFDMWMYSSGKAVMGSFIRFFVKAAAFFHGDVNTSANKVKREPRFPLESIALAIVSIIVPRDGMDA